MKGSKQFKKVIETHLKTRAANDELFAKTFAKENKNIDDCVSYILDEVQKSGLNGFTDDQVFDMAVHYYDEDDLKVSNKEIENIQVVVNRPAKLSEEEISDAKVAAKERIYREVKEEMIKPKKKKVSIASMQRTDDVKPAQAQGSLF